MKNYVMALASILFTGCSLLAVHSSAQPCAEFKGKSYISFTEGKFDTFPNFASAFRVTFDRIGNQGTARRLSATTLDATTGVHEISTFTCTTLAGGIKLFEVKTSSGTSQGGLYYKVFDNGARIWIEHNIPGRRVSGWMLQLTPKPADVKFPD